MGILAHLFAGTLLAAAPGAVVEAGDPVQLWTDIARDFGEGRRFVSTVVTFRVAEGVDVPVWNAEGDLFFKAGDRFTWGPGYKFQQQRDPGEPFEDEHRYLLTGRAAWGAAAWKGDLRGLYEYRDFEESPDTWRFRLRPGLSRALADTGWTFAGSLELFFDGGQDRVSQNRIRLGAQRRLGGGGGFAIYYMIRSDRRDGHWQETQILGTVWKIP